VEKGDPFYSCLLWIKRVRKESPLYVVFVLLNMGWLVFWRPPSIPTATDKVTPNNSLPPAKSYIRKGFLIYEEMRKYLTIYEVAVSHIYDFATVPF
jgi:hypothetical protein